MKKLFIIAALFISASSFGQAISTLPIATGRGEGSILLGVQSGATKTFRVDSIAKIAKVYADSLKGVTDAATANNTSSIISNANAITTKANISSLATINGQSLNNGGINILISGGGISKPLYKELTPVVDTVTWNYDSSSTVNLLTTRTLNLKILGTVATGSAGVIVVKQGATGGDSLKYLGIYLGIGKVANKTSIVGFIKNATGFIFSVDTLSNYIASSTTTTTTTTYDVNAQALFTAAATTGNNYKVAVDSAIRQLKRISLTAGGTAWSKSLMINGRAGSTLAQQAVNWKTPGTYNYTYNGSFAYNANGTKFNGTDTYLSTGFNDSTNLTGDGSDVNVVSIIGQGMTTSYGGILGGFPTANGAAFYIYFRNATTFETQFNSTAEVATTITSQEGRYIAGYSTSTNVNIYKNGSVIDTRTLTLGLKHSLPINEGFTRAVDGSNGIFRPTDARVDVTQIINSKLTTTEAAAIDAVWAAYEIALSR